MTMRVLVKVIMIFYHKYLCHMTFVPFLNLTSLGSPRLPDSPMNRLFLMLHGLWEATREIGVSETFKPW